MKYRGHEIAVDTDFEGTECVYIYTHDGGDPIEVIGGVADAKRLIDDLIREMAEIENEA